MDRNGVPGLEQHIIFDLLGDPFISHDMLGDIAAVSAVAVPRLRDRRFVTSHIQFHDLFVCHVFSLSYEGPSP